jgi:hypothetical protein
MITPDHKTLSSKKLVGAPKFLDTGSTFLEVKKMIGSAVTEILLVSPFINKNLLESVLEAAKPDVSVTLVTRFRILDLLAGFNDLGIYDLFNGQKGMHLRLLHQLHAKYYRGDASVILGSGNLTYMGLPPSGGGNVEVMLKLDYSTQGLREFEENLIQQSLEPTDQMIDELRGQLVELKNTKQVDALLIEAARENLILKTAFWVPQCEMPNCLYEVYTGRVSEIDVEIVRQAKTDLSYLALPSGLNETNFNSNIRISLQQTKVINLMLKDLKLHHRINVSTCRAIVASAFSSRSPAEIDEIWQRYRLWLLVFFDGFTR